MDQTLADLSLTRTSTFEEDPESPFSTVRLTSGWQLLWCNDYDCPTLGGERLKMVSRDQDVLVCRIEEHVMASSAELWSNGRVVWSISHVGEHGPVGLDVTGEPPASLGAIRKNLEAAQAADGGLDADVDHVFEIPLLVAYSLVGFKHDESFEGVVEGRFEVLTSSQAKKQGLLSKLFG